MERYGFCLGLTRRMSSTNGPFVSLREEQISSQSPLLLHVYHTIPPVNISLYLVSQVGVHLCFVLRIDYAV